MVGFKQKGRVLVWNIYLARKQRQNGAFPKGGYRNFARGERIPGAVKFSRVWLIPKDAEKPIDGRRKNIL